MLPRISVVECIDANYLIFSSEDHISNSLFKNGVWEQHLLKISGMFLTGIENPLVIDIGANLGAYSIPLAKRIQGLGGTVIGFEPQRIIYYQLCGNVVLNRLDNYYPIYSAIGENSGEIEIPEIEYEKHKNIGAFSLEKKYRELHGIDNSSKSSTVKVPLISLDDFECNKAPALIKIDVEGFELNVLKGAKKFLAKHNFPPLLFEAWNFSWFVKERNTLLSFIKDLGYEITNFGTSDYIAQHPINSVGVRFIKNTNGSISMERYK
jgi:FkbM family methyltransferase